MRETDSRATPVAHAEVPMEEIPRFHDPARHTPFHGWIFATPVHGVGKEHGRIQVYVELAASHAPTVLDGREHLLTPSPGTYALRRLRADAVMTSPLDELRHSSRLAFAGALFSSFLRRRLAAKYDRELLRQIFCEPCQARIAGAVRRAADTDTANHVSYDLAEAEEAADELLRDRPKREVVFVLLDFVEDLRVGLGVDKWGCCVKHASCSEYACGKPGCDGMIPQELERVADGVVREAVSETLAGR